MGRSRDRSEVANGARKAFFHVYLVMASLSDRCLCGNVDSVAAAMCFPPPCLSVSYKTVPLEMQFKIFCLALRQNTGWNSLSQTHMRLPRAQSLSATGGRTPLGADWHLTMRASEQSFPTTGTTADTIKGVANGLSALPSFPSAINSPSSSSRAPSTKPHPLTSGIEYAHPGGRRAGSRCRNRQCISLNRNECSERGSRIRTARRLGSLPKPAQSLASSSAYMVHSSGLRGSVSTLHSVSMSWSRRLISWTRARLVECDRLSQADRSVWDWKLAGRLYRQAIASRRTSWLMSRRDVGLGLF